MICFINRSTVDYDVRLQKYVSACIETDTPYIVLAWDRLNNCTKVFPNEYQYKAYCPYGSGRKQIVSLIGWYFYVLYHLIKYRKCYKVVHSCNIENCLTAYISRLFGKKMVLDIYDPINIPIERKVAKRVEALILPHRDRLGNQMGLKETDLKRFLEVENVPSFGDKVNEKSVMSLNQTQIRLSYVGVFQKEIRGLENLLNMVERDARFVLEIAGTGGGLDELVKESASSCNRIIYHGKVNYREALSIMSSSHFIVALYYLNEPSHKFASPNKYYESLCLGRPIITSKDTLVGNSVEKWNTGYTVEDNAKSLEQTFEEFGSQGFVSDYMEKSQNCTDRWNKVYKDYFDTVIKGEYLTLMKEICEK